MIGILLVDPQLDFFPGGALGVQDGDAIIKPVNGLLDRLQHAPLYVSRDWHPTGTKHFKARGGPWVPHCMQDTPGAAFHPALLLGERAHVYTKGQDPEDDAGYSAFEGTRQSLAGIHTLGRDLLDDGVTDLIVAGLATDYCVKASVMDALKEGFRVWLFTPGIRPVDVLSGDGERALVLMHEAGAFLFE